MKKSHVAWGVVLAALAIVALNRVAAIRTDSANSPNHHSKSANSITSQMEATKKFGNLLVGMKLDAAQAMSTSAGYLVRVAERDGEGQVLTMDLRTNRIDVAVNDNVIISVIGIG